MFFSDNYVEKARSIKVTFTQVFTPDSYSSQDGKTSKPPVLEPRRNLTYFQENAKCYEPSKLIPLKPTEVLPLNPTATARV